MRAAVVAIEVPGHVGPEKSDVVDWLAQVLDNQAHEGPDSWSLLEYEPDHSDWCDIEEGD